jgi:diguanylate cyclase (GGDEF)-like protein
MKPIVRLTALFILCLLSILLKADRASALESTKRVLFISSYSESFDSVPLQIEGIKGVLSPEDIELDIEYMDTKHFDTKENLELFHSTLKYKLEHSEPYDAVIVGDDSALQFAVDYQNELFPQLPIIFLGINDLDRAKSAGENPYITGIIEEISIKDNINLALRFNPDASRVVAVVDNTITGVGDHEQFLASQEYFPDLKFETLVASDYTLDEMAERIEALKGDTILLYLSMYVDKTGSNITISEASDFFNQHSKVPVYRASIGGVGEGIIGGKMVSFEESGRMAANMVLQVFNGTPVEDIDVVEESPNYYILDYQLLKKFNIDISLAPKGTTFVNRNISFYEQNKHLVWIVSGIISLLTIFTVILVIDNLKRRSIEKALKESHERLTQTYEELAATEEELRDQNIKIKEHSEKINSLNEKYELSTSSTNSAVWELDMKTKEIYFSGNIQTVIGLQMKEYERIDQIITILLDKDAKFQLLAEYHKYAHHEKNEINLQLPINDLNHGIKWIMIRGKGMQNSTENVTLLHGIIIDITKMKEQEIFIEHLAQHDYLTDLPNRLCFVEKLKVELKAENPLAIIMLDIDNFKGINDTLGHVYGDMLLKEIASRLLSIQTKKSFICRFGGDEFLLMLTDKTDQHKIEKYVKNIQDVFRKPFHIGQREHFIEFSMGITRFPDDSQNLDQLIMNADTAMYHVKHTGKNSYKFYNESMQEIIKERAGIEAILRKALKEDGFYLVYQPIVNVLSGEIEAFEALLRLKHHPIPPNIFIRIAEESDLILEIGRKVTKEAVAQLAKWKAMGYPPKILSINFSSKQIRDSGYIQFLHNTLEEYDIDPKYLDIEITESILLDETTYTIEFLYSLREQGVSIALDDFGTGFSSLNYLTYIPVDHVKLDKSCSDKFLELDNIKVMNSIISLVHSLDLVITAEGIEEKSQYERLKESGCDYIQGYYFSKPLEAEQADIIYNKNLLENKL